MTASSGPYAVAAATLVVAALLGGCAHDDARAPAAHRDAGATATTAAPAPAAASVQAVATGGSLDPADISSQHIGPDDARAREIDSAVGARLRSAARTQSTGRVALVVTDPDLEGEPIAEVLPSATFPAASLYKLFVAGTVLQQVDAGTLNLEDATGWSPCPTVQAALELSITWSDNACAHTLGRMVSFETVQEHIDAAGLDATTIDAYRDAAGVSRAGTPTTTARDVATWLTALHHGRLMSAESTALMLSLLGGQQVNHTLPPSLDPGLRFRHKTGEFPHLAHDAGLLTDGDRTLVVVMLSDEWVGYGVNEGQPTFAAITDALLPAFELDTGRP